MISKNELPTIGVHAACRLIQAGQAERTIREDATHIVPRGGQYRSYYIRVKAVHGGRDVMESLRVRRMLRAKTGHCYYNASRTIMEIPEYANAEYVEGVAVVRPKVVIEHGWIERDGKIIDPTLPEEPVMYFPGLRFRGGLGLAKAVKIPNESGGPDLPIFYRFGFGGIASPEMRAAKAAAHRYAGQEQIARQYEEYKPASECA